MPCAWNVPAKIVCTIAGLLALGGIITAIMGYVTGNDAVAPDFEAEEVKQWSVSIASEAQQCAWQIYFKEGEDCQAAVDGLTVSGPATWPQSKYTKHCDSNNLIGFDHVEMDGFNLKWFAQVDPNETVVPGTYSVASSGPDFWVRDVCKEIGEAVGGIFAAMGIMVIAIVLFVLSSIFCCVACCCGGCCSSK